MTGHILRYFTALGLRRDILRMKREELIDTANTHVITGSVLCGIGLINPVCAKLGSLIVVVSGIVYVWGHTKNLVTKDETP